MPIYEYKCHECGQVFDALQPMSAPPLTECVHCHGPVEKLISASAFHLKGSGWYVTDYKGRKNGSTSSPPTEATSPKNSEGKPAPPTTPAPAAPTPAAS